MARQRTLVIGDEDGEERGDDGPRARVRDSIDDKLELRRKVDWAILEARQRRRETCRVHVHVCGDFYVREAVEPGSATGDSKKSGDWANGMRRRTLGRGRRTRDLGDQERAVETCNFQRSSKAIYRVEGGSFHVLDLGSLEGAVEFAKRGGSARGRPKKKRPNLRE